MKNIKLYLLLIIFNLGYAKAYSQSIMSEVRKNNYHLDIDVKNAFRGLDNAAIIFKKKYQKGNLIDVNAVKLRRFKVEFDLQNTFTTNPIEIENNTKDIFVFPSDYVYVNIGYGLEKQIQSKAKFVHYFGCDLGLGFSFRDGFSNSSSPLDTDRQFFNVTQTLNATYEFFRVTTNELNVLISPFFGVKYYFNNQISIGIETGLHLSYFGFLIQNDIHSRERIGNEYFVTIENFDKIFAHGIKSEFNGLKHLTIGYTF